MNKTQKAAAARITRALADQYAADGAMAFRIIGMVAGKVLLQGSNAETAQWFQAMHSPIITIGPRGAVHVR